MLEPGGASFKLLQVIPGVGVLAAFWHHLVAAQCITTEVRKGPTLQVPGLSSVKAAVGHSLALPSKAETTFFF